MLVLREIYACFPVIKGHGDLVWVRVDAVTSHTGLHNGQVRGLAILRLAVGFEFALADRTAIGNQRHPKISPPGIV